MKPVDLDLRYTSTPALTLLAIGVVYGDIGTSPLYALKETFNPVHGIALTATNILGGLSTVFWILMIIVSLKYVTLVLRANNRGEGGIMALLALATRSIRRHPRLTSPLLVVGVLGAALFYGDAILTPAVSVLSAVEGLEVGTTAFKPYVMPIAAGILVALFLIQKKGTGTVGSVFGPVCVAWFSAIAAAGAWNVARNPAVLEALNPLHAVRFVTGHGFASFVVLGSAILAITGAEALYADMGHFGKRPIRIAWFGLVAPALVLNYFGQGALLIANPATLENPFYLSFPGWALYPMIALATAATVIASQATISGAYSLTHQAIQLGYLPRMRIEHTSAKAIGQVYVPAVNWILLAGVGAAVIGFGTSTSLMAAYGIAVMGTMLATTFLTFFVVRYYWSYPLWVCLLATGFFALIEAALLGAALHKVFDGGWLPLAIGSGIFLVMMTWRRGRSILFERLEATSIELQPFLRSLEERPPQRVPGAAVFLTANPHSTPRALLHSLKHYGVLHEQVVLLTVEIRDVPWVPFDERAKLERLGNGFWRARLRFGFKNEPDVQRALPLLGELGLRLEPMETTFFLSREKIVPVEGARPGMALWRERMFAAMSRNAGNVSDYFNVPANRVVELGTRVEM